MATVVFDFDSTLVTCESLELILEQKLVDQPELMQQIHQITDAGIRGKIPFSESLAKRLEIAAPTREDAREFGKVVLQMITPGMEHLIENLHEKQVDIWIVSGGIQESLLPVGKKLGIKDTQILGVKLKWSEEGDFLGIDSNDPFSRSKVEGVQGVVNQWSSPKIVVGDAMSDYRLFENGLVDHFVLFSENLQCQEIIKLGVDEAKNVAELEEVIDAFLG